MDRPFVVLQSVPPPRATTNPYVVLLARSLAELPGVEVRHFTWRAALLARYDVFHAHWPETLTAGRSAVRRQVRQALFAALLVRLRLTRTPWVRTVHNLELPTGLGRREVLLLRWAERRTVLRVRLNPCTPVRAPAVTVPHGHYRDWFAPQPGSEPVPGRITFAGLVRRYKGVEDLLRAFATTAREHPGLTLRVAGAPSSPELAAGVRDLAAADPRVSLRLGFLDDHQLVHELTSAELVVFPAPLMHNSGGVLAALSLDRPVLVVDNEVNRALGEETGPGWVLRYPGELTGARLVQALEQVRAGGRSATPDLSAREWDAAGRAHLAAFRTAVAHVRGTGHRA